MVNEAGYLVWNCELKPRLSDTVSHLRMNAAQKMASQSSTKQNGEATTEEVPDSSVTYTEEEIDTFKDGMAFENTKTSTPLAIVLNPE